MEFDEKDFLDIVCPKCGGTIVLSEDKTHGICPYCVSEYLLAEEELVKAENEAGIEREISGVHLREISRNTLDGYIFQRMDDETSQKYLRYRYRKIISMKMFAYISFIFASLYSFIMMYWLEAGNGFGNEWIVIAGSFLCIVWIVMIAIPRLYHMTEDIRDAEGYCEYTYAIVDFSKEMKFICSDGQKMSFKMKMLTEDDAGDGDAAILVHVPSIGTVYIEDIGNMKRKFALSELQRG